MNRTILRRSTMSWRRRVGRGTALVAVLALGLTACASGPPGPAVPPEAPEGASITYAFEADIDHLDPRDSSVVRRNDLLKNIFETLVEVTMDGGLQPGLATEWSQGEDGLTWTFEIREDATFHDGTAVDAEAVKFSLDRLIGLGEFEGDPGNEGYRFAHITAVDAVGSHTVEIVTAEPFGPLAESLAPAQASIVSPAAVRESGDGFGHSPVGSGAYRVESFSISRVVIQAYAQYWRGAPQAVTEIVYTAIPEAGARLAALEAGEADIAALVPPHEITRIREASGLGVIQVPANDVRIVQLNTLHPALSDVRVRQALNYAIDVPSLVDSILDGNGEFIGGPLPAGFPGSITAPAEGTYSYDPARAQELLEDAGYGDGLELQLFSIVSGAAGIEEVLQGVQAQWAEVGVTVELNFLEFAAYLEVANVGPEEWEQVGKELTATGISSRYLDNHAILFTGYHSSQWSPAGINRGYYQNDRVDELLELAVSSGDPEERLAMYQEAQRLLLEDAPAVWMYDGYVSHGVTSEIEGLVGLTPMLFTGFHEFWRE